MMLSTLGSHFRRNLVAYLALFVALGGTAVAAKPLLTGADIQDGSLTDADVATANKDGTADTLSLRTLGKGAQQAASGDDVRLSDARVPTGTAGGDLAGTYPNPTIAGGTVGPSEFSSTIPAASVTNAGSQTLPISLGTGAELLLFDSETYDTADLHSTTANTSRLTAAVTGVYRVEAEVDWTPTSTALDIVRIDLAVNRTFGPAAPRDEEAKDLSNGNHLRAGADLKLTAGSYVEVVATHAGASEQVFARRFTMSWIAPG